MQLHLHGLRSFSYLPTAFRICAHTYILYNTFVCEELFASTKIFSIGRYVFHIFSSFQRMHLNFSLLCRFDVTLPVQSKVKIEATDKTNINAQI